MVDKCNKAFYQNLKQNLFYFVTESFDKSLVILSACLMGSTSRVLLMCGKHESIVNILLQNSDCNLMKLTYGRLNKVNDTMIIGCVLYRYAFNHEVYTLLQTMKVCC